MNIRITALNNTSPEEWDRAVCECMHATFFHTLEWAEIWREYEGLVPRAKTINYSDGNMMILPCSYYAQNGKENVIMSPAGTYGGGLYNFAITKKHSEQTVRYLCKNYCNFTLRQNPIEPVTNYQVIRESRRDVTYMISFDEGLQVLERTWNKTGILRKVKKAIRSGVIVEQASSIEDWRQYYSVYLETIRRWGEAARTRYNWSLFEAFYRHRSQHICLWVARCNGRIISGAICFYQNNHAVYWHGAALEAFFYLRPMNLLMCEIIKDALTRGFRWFDFNPNPGLEGVARFKKSFGALERSSNIYISRRKPQLKRITDRIKKGILQITDVRLDRS